MEGKQPVPNICQRTGISRDYKTALGTLHNLLQKREDDPRSVFLAKRFFTARAIPRYQEYFSDDKYEGVVTDSNRETVDRINTIIDSINQERDKLPTNSQDAENMQRLRVYYSEIVSLIQGPEYS